ncbi:MAG: glycosyltransferase [Proteobacteria bacterium]|nr:glycosyltransferase [Pseudomonadota bacterium]
MGTKVRLPTTEVPPPTPLPAGLEGTVPELVGLLVLRNAEDRVTGYIERLAERCDSVLVVDDGSTDATAERAREAGARVLNIPAPRGEGAGLRAGMQLARELGYIGAVWTPEEGIDSDTLTALALAHVTAPEALILGVGPGEALAGKEWDEARAIAAGEEPAPYPDWRPPKADGLPGAVEQWFEKLVETRFGYPWGGPRMLPLQGLLRRDLREDGPACHMELLAMAVAAGIPTVEIELASSPNRPVVTCRKAALRLLSRIIPMTLTARGRERLGLGGGYAPPTTSPLQLLLSASVAVAMTLALSGCPKPVGPDGPVAACEEDLPRSSWPGGGDAQVALTELVQARADVETVWVEQGVEFTDPSLDGAQKLRGVLAKGGHDRLRLRLLGPMGVTVLDYVEARGRWQLAVPPAGLFRTGGPDDPLLDPDMAEGASMVRADLVASLIHSIDPDAAVRWQDGACAVLEEIEQETVVRRLAFRPDGEGWLLGTEQLLLEGEVRISAAFSDYRPVDASVWAWRSEITDPVRGSRIVLLTKKLRTEGITDAFFALADDSAH